MISNPGVAMLFCLRRTKPRTEKGSKVMQWRRKPNELEVARVNSLEGSLARDGSFSNWIGWVNLMLTCLCRKKLHPLPLAE